MIVIAPMKKVVMKNKLSIVEDEDTMPTYFGIMSSGQVETSKSSCYSHIKGCFLLTLCF